MIMLCLQIQGMLVVHSNFSVALQEQLFVVTDPIKHLKKERKQNNGLKMRTLPWTQANCFLQIYAGVTHNTLYKILPKLCSVNKSMAYVL